MQNSSISSAVPQFPSANPRRIPHTNDQPFNFKNDHGNLSTTTMRCNDTIFFKSSIDRSIQAASSDLTHQQAFICHPSNSLSNSSVVVKFTTRSLADNAMLSAMTKFERLRFALVQQKKGQAPTWLHSHSASALFDGLSSRWDANKANADAPAARIQPEKQKHNWCPGCAALCLGRHAKS